MIANEELDIDDAEAGHEGVSRPVLASGFEVERAIEGLAV